MTSQFQEVSKGSNNLLYAVYVFIVTLLLVANVGSAVAFQYNDRVEATDNLKVRSFPSLTGTHIDTVSSGGQGRIVNGPYSGSGYTWWYVDWDNYKTGYSVENYLTPASLPAPSISSVSPDPMPGSTSRQTMTINGSNFVSGASLEFIAADGGTFNSNATYLTFNSSSKITYQINNDNDGGTWRVRVNNPDGQSSSYKSFTVTSTLPAPSISSVSPDPMLASTALQAIKVKGSNFTPGSTGGGKLRFTDPSGNTYDSTAHPERIGTVTSTEWNYQINNDEHVGTWKVQVINADGQASNQYSFQVAAAIPAPNISSVSPSSMLASTALQAIKVTGSNFTPGSTGGGKLRFTDPSGNTYDSTAHPERIGTVTSTEWNYQINNDAHVGTWKVQVINADGQVSNQQNFQVTAQSTGFSIQGSILLDGDGLQDVNMSLSGTASKQETSGSSGAYFFSGLSNGSYTVTPALAGHEFSPPNSSTVSINGLSLKNVDFRACNSNVSLTILLKDANGRPIEGANVSAKGISAIETTSGSYVVSGLGCASGDVMVSTLNDTHRRSFDRFTSSQIEITLNIDSAVNGNPPNTKLVGDPVNTATGNYVYQYRDLDIHGIGLPFRFERTYNSIEASGATATATPIGYGWTHSYHVVLSKDTGDVTILWGDGHTETHVPDGVGGYTPQHGVFNTLVDDGGGTLMLTKRDRTKYYFDTNERLTKIVDNNSNTQTLNYTGDDLTSMIDTAGRTVTFSYDGSGRLTMITDPINRTVKYTYDANGDLISATDPNNNVTTYTYDGEHQMLTVVDPRGNTVVTNMYDGANRVVSHQLDAKGNGTWYEYNKVDGITTITDALDNVTVHHHDAYLRLIKEEDARGGVALYEYDMQGNRVKVTDKKGDKTQYSYDTYGNVTGKTDALGHTTSITYDINDNPVSRTDALGNVTRFSYDANGNLIQTTDALDHVTTIIYLLNGLPETTTDFRGNTTTNSYDAEGNLITVEDALTNLTQYTYDSVGRRLSTTDALGRTIKYTYDANDNLLSVADPLDKLISHVYDTNDNKIKTTDRKGNSIQWVYDEKDLLVTRTDVQGKVESYVYDALDRRISTTDLRGNTTHNAYDEVGNLIEVTDPLGNKRSYSYDLQGNRISKTDANGSAEHFTYDALNRLIQTEDALGNTASTTYDVNGNRASSTDARGHTTTFTYDALKRLTQTTDALGNSMVNAYDTAGNRISVTDPLGHSTTTTYDVLNRPVTQTDALGNITTTTYDAVGNVKTISDANGENTSFDYDSLNWLTKVTDANGGIVQYGYDANGNRTGMIDPNGNATAYAYDALNRRTKTTEPLGHITDLAYDETGNVIQKSDPKGQVTQHVYDVLNRLTDIDYATQPDVAFDYDAVGNLTVMTDGLGATSHLYDALNRRTSTTGPLGKSVGYGYDANGNRIELTYPGSKQVAYGYDALNRLTTVTDWLSNVTIYSYDAANRLIETVNANGTRTDYDYDNANRLTGLSNTKSDATVINAYSYTLDPIGNHLSEERNELLSPVIFADTVTDTHDAENRLVASNGIANTFDANGNMTGKGTNSYAYDGADRLVQTTIGGISSQYQYDGQGNRYVRIHDGMEQRYVLDTNTNLTNVLAETDVAGNIQAYNVYGQGLIARIAPDNRVLHYHYDSRGSTIALTDEVETLQQQYAYDPFGRIANVEGIEINPFGYLGRYGVMDEGGDLNYIRARYYDSEQQRFISKDTYLGDDRLSQTLNRYAYAMNSPVRMVDISGFDPMPGDVAINLSYASDDAHSLLLDEFAWKFAGELSDDGLKVLLKTVVNNNGFNALGEGAFAYYQVLTYEWVPVLGSVASFVFEYYDDDNVDSYWMERASRASWSMASSAIGSLVTIGSGGNPVPGAFVTAGLDTYGYYGVEYVGDIGGDILYNGLGVYNPDLTLYDATIGRAGDVGGDLLYNAGFFNPDKKVFGLF